MSGKALVACEESQRICTALRAKGWEAYSCDLQECSGNHPEWHVQGDALALINGDCTFSTMGGAIHSVDGEWDLLIAHPPCTYLSGLGAPHLYYGTERVTRQKDTFRLMNEERVRSGILARDFFMAFLNARCQHIAVENPQPSTLWQLPPASQVIQPYEYGDPYRKKTLLWLRGLPCLTPTNIVTVEFNWVDGGHKANDKRSMFDFRDPKTRSKTFPGIAHAIADQWTEYLTNEH